MRGERCNAARENEGSNDGTTVPPLRTHFTSVCTKKRRKRMMENEKESRKDLSSRRTRCAGVT